MAIYRKFDPRTWADEKFRERSVAAQYIFIYLITGPVTTSLPGLIHAGPRTLEEKLGGEKAFKEAFGIAFEVAFNELIEKKLIKFNEKATVIRRPKCFRYDKPQSPRVLLGWAKHYDLVPDCDLKREYYRDLQAVCEKMDTESTGNKKETYLARFKEGFGEASLVGDKEAYPVAYPEGDKKDYPIPESREQRTENSKESTTAQRTQGAGKGQSPGSKQQDACGVVVDSLEISEETRKLLAEAGLSGGKIQELAKAWPEAHLVRAAEHAIERGQKNPSGYFLKIVENPNLAPSPQEKQREQAAQRAERAKKQEAARVERETAAAKAEAEENARSQKAEEAWAALSESDRQQLLELAKKLLGPATRNIKASVLSKAMELAAEPDIYSKRVERLREVFAGLSESQKKAVNDRASSYAGDQPAGGTHFVFAMEELYGHRI